MRRGRILLLGYRMAEYSRVIDPAVRELLATSSYLSQSAQTNAAYPFLLVPWTAPLQGSATEIGFSVHIVCVLALVLLHLGLFLF